MTRAEARTQIRGMVAVVRGQGEHAAADALHRALRRHLAQLAAQATTQALIGRLGRRRTQRPRA